MDSQILIQFVKYAIAGGVATLTHIGVFHLAAWQLFPSLTPNDLAVRVFKLSVTEVDDSTRSRNSMLGNVFAFLFSNLIAYILNILWVFERGRHPLIIEIALFYAVSGISVFIGTAIMGFLIRRFGMITTHAFAANIFSAVMINYAVRKYFIFVG